MLRVVIQQPVAGLAEPRYGLDDFSFRPGEIVDLDNALAEAWIASGIATSKDEIEAELPPPPDPGSPSDTFPTGEPTETCIVQWPVKIADTDIALTAVPTTVVVGSVFVIDLECMTVTDISNPDNPAVTRATHGTDAATHEAGATVLVMPADSAKTKQHKKPPASARR
jgi:hypothetical protein